MKNLNFILLSLLLIISISANAQQKPLQIDSLSKRPQAVFFEVLGSGGLYSFNYDTRFEKRADGLGIKGGSSYTQVSESSLFTIPIQLNYLLGKKGKFFEIGLGATYATAGLDLFDEGDDETGSTVFGTMTFGYRSQPIDGGFMFRTGVSPVFGNGFFIPYFPYLSLGYSF